LFVSFVMSMHTPPQSTRPVGHRHAPAVHAWSMRQRVPQAPQLRTSLESETHELPQRTWPIEQPDAHVRVIALQYGVAPEHVTPHAPQLKGSVPRSTQNPLQFVVPGGHVHVPPKQPWPGAHARPQAPQLLRSADGSRQRPPQSIMPPGQLQTPL
jgi:hypothetical protein